MRAKLATRRHGPSRGGHARGAGMGPRRACASRCTACAPDIVAGTQHEGATGRPRASHAAGGVGPRAAARRPAAHSCEPRGAFCAPPTSCAWDSAGRQNASFLCAARGSASRSAAPQGRRVFQRRAARASRYASCTVAQRGRRPCTAADAAYRAPTCCVAPPNAPGPETADMRTAPPASRACGAGSGRGTGVLGRPGACDRGPSAGGISSAASTARLRGRGPCTASVGAACRAASVCTAQHARASCPRAAPPAVARA